MCVLSDCCRVSYPGARTVLLSVKDEHSKYLLGYGYIFGGEGGWRGKKKTEKSDVNLS